MVSSRTGLIPSGDPAMFSAQNYGLCLFDAVNFWHFTGADERSCLGDEGQDFGSTQKYLILSVSYEEEPA